MIMPLKLSGEDFSYLFSALIVDAEEPDNIYRNLLVQQSFVNMI